jgi:uncharacterized protein (TIGR02466 family)
MELFPIAVSKHKIPVDLLNTTDVTKSIKYKVNEGNKSSINSYVLNSETLVNLKNIIEIKLNDHFHTIYQPLNKDLQIYITQSWVNSTSTLQYHHRHYHANSVLSGILYLEVSEEDNIQFNDSRNSNLILDFPIENYTILNSGGWILNNLEEGDMLLFPSSLEHEVPIKRDNSPNRISLSFNTWIKGMLGDDQSRTSLLLE